MYEISIQMHNDAFLQNQIQDQILALLQRESSYISSSTTTKNYSPPLKHIRNRAEVLKWYYNFVAHYQYDREVITMSMDYLDRFLLSNSTAKDITTRTYKLVAMTSLYLGVKLHVGDISTKRKIHLQDYASLSEGLFSPENISSMERCILDTLNWRVHPVSPMCFVRYFLKLMEPIIRKKVINNLSGNNISQDGTYERIHLCIEVLSSIALYFTELTICMPETTAYFHLNRSKHCSMDRRTFAPSIIAYASILLSMEMVSYSALPFVIRESFLQKCTQLRNKDHNALHPDRKDIKELQVRIQKNFTLDKILNQTAARDGRDYRCISETNPIDTAIRYGILNSRFLEGISTCCAIDSAETLSYGDLDHSLVLSRGGSSSIPDRVTCRASPNIPVSTAKRKPIVCKHYHSSPTSSMDKDASSCKLPARKRMRCINPNPKKNR